MCLSVCERGGGGGERETETEHTMEGEIELLLRGVYAFCSVYSIKRKQGVPVLIYASGQAGSSV